MFIGIALCVVHNVWLLLLYLHCIASHIVSCFHWKLLHCNKISQHFLLQLTCGSTHIATQQEGPEAVLLWQPDSVETNTCLRNND